MRLADARLATAAPGALCLADLVQGAWRRVAVRERCRDEDVWTWDIEDGKRLIVLAREAGRVTTAQQRQPDGAMWLLAKVA